MKTLILLALLFPPLAPAIFIGTAAAHDDYSGVRNKEGTSCCNGQDCKRIVHESEIDILPGGGYRVRSSGEFIREGKVADSPNAEWHMCRRAGTMKPGAIGQYNYDGEVRCLMIPQGGM